MAGPYTSFSDFAADVTDAGLRQLAIAQQCWLSVDLVRRTTTGEDAERFIGRALAELAPADAAVLVQPRREICRRFDGELRRRLARGRW